jgi:hypothetical protein
MELGTSGERLLVIEAWVPRRGGVPIVGRVVVDC